MLLSKDIKSNNKFPEFIRYDRAFDKRQSFDKVFHHIGLENAEQDVSEIKPSLWHVCASSAQGMRMNFSRGTDKSWAKNIGWGILGTPLLFADLALDCLYVRRFRKEHKDLDLKVVFSASDKEGAWDIATMSMRGISSCQTWGAGRSHQLIGSIVDPCCGVIYLTNGKKTKYGREMMYRAVVRYVMHRGLGPCLFMEQTYPVSKDSNTIRAVNLLFAAFLRKRCKLPVIYDYCLINSDSLRHAFIPSSGAVNENLYSSSYRDSSLEYRALSDVDCNRFPPIQVIKDKYLIN